jgi:hypothetical protein
MVVKHFVEKIRVEIVEPQAQDRYEVYIVKCACGIEIRREAEDFARLVSMGWRCPKSDGEKQVVSDAAIEGWAWYFDRQEDGSYAATQNPRRLARAEALGRFAAIGVSPPKKKRGTQKTKRRRRVYAQADIERNRGLASAARAISTRVVERLTDRLTTAGIPLRVTDPGDCDDLANPLSTGELAEVADWLRKGSR